MNALALVELHWLSGLVAPFARHPTRTFVAVGLLFALAYVTAHVWFPKPPPGRVIDGDALGLLRVAALAAA